MTIRSSGNRDRAEESSARYDGVRGRWFSSAEQQRRATREGLQASGGTAGASVATHVDEPRLRGAGPFRRRWDLS